MKQLVYVFMLATLIWSCNDDDVAQLQPVEATTFENLFAPLTSAPGQPPAGDFVKFSFAEGAVVDADATDWDIAFRGTTILVNGGDESATDEPGRTGNGGAYIVEGTYNDVTSVLSGRVKEDATTGPAIPTGSGNGWYTYNPATFVISPIAGRILVIRTHDGKYAKMEILSYYKDSPANPSPFVNESRHYTFNYTYQPNEGILSF